MAEQQQPIIIKKINKSGGGHHGGAWKVAYADFVTAMMAFFMLLWLLNVVTDEAKQVISSYFDPSNPKIAQDISGAGGVLGGLSVAQRGSMASTAQPLQTPNLTGYAGQDEKEGDTTAKVDAEVERRSKSSPVNLNQSKKP